MAFAGKALKTTVAGLAVASGLAVSQPAVAAGRSYIKAGLLTCKVSGGVGLILGSRKSVACTFQPDRRVPEFYGGNIRRVGLDIGVTSGSVIVWAVLSTTTAFPVGALAGTYAGLSAEASVVFGLGANALVGGSESTFALQPLSVQGQVGVNLAAGVTKLQLYAQ